MKAMLNDVKRILILTENLLYIAGKSLQRRAMRNGVLVSLAVSSTIIRTNYLTSQSLTSEQITTLLIGAFASYPAGTLMVRVANFLTRNNLDAAAGGHLFLTSHYKQSRLRLHLRWLWHEVFRFEAEDSDVRKGLAARAYRKSPTTIFSGDERIFQSHCESDDSLVRRALFGDEEPHLENDFRSFEESGVYALRSPLPMGVQSAEVGFHLGPLEDWHEKGFFALEDYPAKSFVRDPVVKRIQRMVESPLLNRINRVMAMDTAPSFWYVFTVRKFGARLGKAITVLNNEAEALGYPDYFDAQHFLWPSLSLDNEVKLRFHDNDHLFNTLKNLRTNLMTQVFSDDPVTIRRHIMRMFARDYAMILKLRLKFDAAYAAGRLGYNPQDEVHRIEAAFGLRLLKPKLLEASAASAKQHLEMLDKALWPDNSKSHTRLYHAMEVAAHIDYKQFRSVYLAEGRFDINTVSSEVIESETSLFIALLHRIRLYHALLKIQILDYWTIVARIGDTEKAA